MKKIIIIAALLLAACTAVNAENTTRIGSVHRFDYGAFIGWSQGATWWYGMGFIDLNAANNNFRTRLSLGLAERPFLGGKGFNPNVGLNFQYLLRLSDAFYLYPTVGGYYEHFSTKTAHSILNNVGIEGGAGLELQFSSNFGFFAEGAYRHMFLDKTSVEKTNRFTARAGIVLHF